jgi:hypothetical protein
MYSLERTQNVSRTTARSSSRSNRAAALQLQKARAERTGTVAGCVCVCGRASHKAGAGRVGRWVGTRRERGRAAGPASVELAQGGGGGHEQVELRKSGLAGDDVQDVGVVVGHEGAGGQDARVLSRGGLDEEQRAGAAAHVLVDALASVGKAAPVHQVGDGGAGVRDVI